MEEEKNKVREPSGSENTQGQRNDPKKEEKKRAPGSEEENPGGPANRQKDPHLQNQENEEMDEKEMDDEKKA